MRFLKVGGIVVSLAAGVLGVLFTLQPDLKPCLGETSAEFTGAPVFPRSRYSDHLERNELPPEDRDVIGAVVRFSYRLSGLKRETITVTSTLVSVDKMGTLGGVVRDADGVPAGTFEPKDCSETGGNDVFVQFVEPGKRYRIVLELYRDKALKDRIALTQTDVFQG